MMATLVCPLVSAGKDISHMCLEEECAWYLKNYKACSAYVLAYNAALDIKTKQNNK